MRKKILRSLAGLLLPFAAYSAQACYGAYQRRSLSRTAGYSSLDLGVPSPSWLVRDPVVVAADRLATVPGHVTRELVIVDASVKDRHVILQQARPGLDVVEIPAGASGTAAFAQALQGYHDLRAVHVVAHAEAGAMFLGGHRVDQESLLKDPSVFAALNRAVREGGDLLLYGCDLAQGEAGEDFLEILRENTHVDTAASIDQTGHEAFGGDWDLEISTGNIDTKPLPHSIALKDFSDVLAASNGTYGFQNGWNDAGNTLTSTHFTVGARDTNSSAPVNVSIYNAIPYPAYIQNGYVSGSNYFYVSADGVNTGSFELTGVTAGEYLTGQFTNLHIVGVLPDNTTVTSSTINGTGTTEENFNFGAGQLTNFAGVQLKAFKLYFDTASPVSTVPFFEFRTFSIANAQNPAASDGNVTAAGGVTEPVGLDTTRDTVGEAVDVLDFTISDGGTGDVFPLNVSQVVVNVSGTSTNAERGKITWRLNGPDASNVTGTYNAGTNKITFSGLSISVANGGNETYTVNAYYNDNTGITDGHTVILSIDGDTDLTVSSGGTKMGSTSPVTNGTGSTLDVVATQLVFTTQPAGSVSGAALTTQPVVAARDAFGNVDMGFTETITLTEASAGALTNNTQAATSGVATFTNLIYTATADQQAFTLTANDQDGVGSDLPTADSNSVNSNVVAIKLLFTTQPAPTTISSGAVTNFSTVPVVSAVDANNTLDTDYSTGIVLSVTDPNDGIVDGTVNSLTSTGDSDGSATMVTLTPSSGSATFSNLALQYTNGGSSDTIALRASSGGLSSAFSSTITSNSGPVVTDTNISISGASGTGGAFKIGDTVTATWNNTAGGDNNSGILSVTVDFSQFGGGAAVAATNSSDTWTATYTIVAGAIEATNRNVSVSATNTAGTTTIADSTNATVDNRVPGVSSVSVPANATYAAGQNLDFTVNTDENVTINTTGGTPRLALTIGATTRYASYLSGSGTSALVFRHTVQAGDLDANGIEVSGTLEANGGTLQDGVGNGLNPTLNAVGPTTGVLVDAVAPAVTSVTVPANATYSTGQNLDFTVNTDENVTVDTAVGTPYVALTIGSSTRLASYLSGSGTSALVFRYTVQAGDLDADGIEVSSALETNGGTMRDAVTNDLNPALNAVGSTTGVLVDAAAPSGHSVSFDDDAIHGTEAAAISFTFANAEVGANYSYTISSSGGGVPVSDTGTIVTSSDQISGIDVSGLNDGTLTLSVTLTDAAGNSAAAVTDTATLDANPPSGHSVSFDEGEINGTEASAISFTFASAEVGADYNYTISSSGGGTPVAGAGTVASAGEQISGIDVSGLSDGTLTLSVILTDAAGNSAAAVTDTASLDTIAPVNTVPGAQTTTTVVPLVFSSGNGNAISVAEANSLTTVVSVGAGTLTATTGGGATITNNGTATVTLEGTAAQVNTALEGLTYTPNGAGAQTIAVQSADIAGNTDDDTIAVTVENGTLVVTSNLDTGDDATAAGSLAADQADGDGLSIREALNWARSGDTITFDLDSGTPGNQGGTITLDGSALVIANNNLMIDGDLDDDGSSDVTISGNNATRVLITNINLTGIELSGLTLTQGAGVGGAGLSIGNGSTITLRDSNITNNNESGLGGAGIFGTSTNLTIINSTISGNISDTFGGGIRIVGTSVVTLINSTVSGNKATGIAQHGGGIQFAGSTLILINSTISGNAASGASANGGGIRMSAGVSYLYNSTIVGNAATSSGGGISASAGTTNNFINTVVAGNTAGAGATAAVGGAPLATGGSANDVDGTIATATNSYFGTTATITTDSGSFNNQGTSNLLLGNLVDNGGSVFTHQPQSGSALLDAGSTSALPVDTFDLDGDNDMAEVLPIDAIGRARLAGSAVDIGAVEEDQPPVITSTLVASGTYGAAFSYTITATNSPASYAAAGLPSGLSLDNSTGAITGVAATVGVFNVELTATNNAGTSAPATLVLTVAKATQTISFPAIADQLANAAPFPLGATASSGNTVAYTVISGPATIAGSTVTLTGAGSVTIRASQAGDANYEAAPDVDRMFNVTKVAGTVTLTGLAQTYDGSAKIASATTTPSGLTVTFTYNGGSSAPTNAGSYAVVATIDDAIYSGTANGTLTIAKATPTITWPTPAPIAYGAALDGTQLNATANVPGSFNYTPAAGTILGAGDAQPLAVTFTPDDLTNFTTASAGTTITVNKVSATVTLADLRQTYDGTPRAATATTDPVGLTVAITYDGSATVPSEPGQYAVVATIQDANHSGSVTGTLVIEAPIVQVYFGDSGTQGEAGEIAGVIAKDFSGGTLIGYLSDSAEGFVVHFTLEADGTFEATTTTMVGNPEPSTDNGEGMAAAIAAPRTLTFRGLVSGGVLTGTIDELGLPFGATRDPISGPTADVAGFYQASSHKTASGDVFTVVGTVGDVYVLALTRNQLVAGAGLIDAAGEFSVSGTGGVPVNGAIDAADGTVSGTITLSDDAQQTFSGTEMQRQRTDLLVNYSSRGRTGNGGDVLIGGFVVSGSTSRQLLLRAVGPGLTPHGVQDIATDPRLRVYDSAGQLIAENDDWDQASVGSVADAVFAFPLATGSKDAAAVVTLAPGAYTMHVTDPSGQGVALAEVYDTSSESDPTQRLVNVSARGRVEAGERVLIGGFVVTGNAPKRVLIRGAGPALAHSLSGALSDPVLYLFDSDGKVIAANDNWGTPQPILPGQIAATADEIADASSGAFAFAFDDGSQDAALIITLAPGAYTAQVSGAGGTTGVALIEVYELAP